MLIPPFLARALYHSTSIFITVFPNEFFERLIKAVWLHGLGKMRVHADLQRPLYVFVKSVRGHGDDGDLFRVGPVQRANGFRCGKTVHLGHPDVPLTA